MTNITTADLITIRDMIRSFKRRECILYNNRLYTLPSLNYFAYTSIIPTSINGVIIDGGELGPFVNGITIESEFEDINGTGYFINNNGNELHLNQINQYDISVIHQRSKLADDTTNMVYLSQMYDITQEAQPLFTMHKVDGSFNLIKDGYYMTIPSMLLPLNKNDKLYLQIRAYNDNTFVSCFVVEKKKGITIHTYVRYIKV